MNSYDLELLSRPARDGDQGWCFGHPPGIAAHQWPLDPISGWPLKHGFTLLLPEDHRVHGPDVVALAFFAPAPEHAAAPPRPDPALVAAVLAESPRRPGDPDLVPFWTAGRQAHPRLTRLRDDRGHAYAVILLTGAEFHGPRCPPPMPADNPYLAHLARPLWLAEAMVHPAAAIAAPALADRAVVARTTPAPTAANHIAGPDDPADAFARHRLNFEESFGGIALGGGRACLDLATMRLDRFDP